MSNAKRPSIADDFTTVLTYTVREPHPTRFDISDLPGLGPMTSRHIGDENWYFITKAGVHGYVKIG